MSRPLDRWSEVHVAADRRRRDAVRPIVLNRAATLTLTALSGAALGFWLGFVTGLAL